MTTPDTNRILAEFECRDPYCRAYCFDRNNLAEVLGRLTPEQWFLAYGIVCKHTNAPAGSHRFSQWLLTCDPAIIADAVASVVGEVGR